MNRRARRLGGTTRLPAGLLVAVLALAGLASSAAPPAAAAPPLLPIADDGGFVTDLSAPVLPPGGTGAITFAFADPMTVPLRDATLTLQLYAFAPAPGGSSGPLPSPGVTFPSAGSNGTTVVLSDLPANPGGGATGETIPVAAAGGSPDGAYALRISLDFVANGSSYALRSRGFFTSSEWEAATLANGSNAPATINLTALGVSGVLPETAVGVRSASETVPIEVLAAGGVLLAGVGAFVYYRRGPGSRSGAAGPSEPQSAPRAVGK